MMITSVSDPGYLELSDMEKMEVLVYEREKIIKDKDKVITSLTDPIPRTNRLGKNESINLRTRKSH